MTERKANSRICAAEYVTQTGIHTAPRKSLLLTVPSLGACNELFRRCAHWTGLSDTDSRRYPNYCLVALPTKQPSNSEIG